MKILRCKQRVRLLTLLVGLFFVGACNLDTCSKRLGFSLDYYMFEKVRVGRSTYCELVNQSLDGNETAITNLSKVDVYDGASYQHGAVLIEVIDKISERKYLDLIQTQLPENMRRRTLSYLHAGMDYTENAKYKGKKMEEAFPLLSQFIQVTLHYS